MSRTNIKSISTEKTHEGGQVKGHLSPINQLKRTVMACMLFEGTFYEDGTSIADRIINLVKKCKFEEVAALTIEARTKMKLRHVPLLLTRELIRSYNGKKVGDLIFEVIQRPDELGELMALYWKDNKNAPIASQMKIGLARALKKFNEYELAKWNKDGDVKLRDILFLTHAKPKNSEQEVLFKKLAEDKLETPDTWEVALSGGANKKEAFERLLKENKLGALALLRNLRLMLECNVSQLAIKTALDNIKTERVLPFRFISAARYAPQFEPSLEQAMFKCLTNQEKIKGKTAFLIDHSGSMKWTITGKGEITRFEAAAGVAMILREACEEARFFAFSDHNIAEIPPRRGFALKDAAETCMTWGGTYIGEAVKLVNKSMPNYDRIIVITDEQSSDVPPHPLNKGYIINVAVYQNGIGYGPWTTINGWSEAIIDYIKEYENDTQSS